MLQELKRISFWNITTLCNYLKQNYVIKIFGLVNKSISYPDISEGAHF